MELLKPKNHLWIIILVVILTRLPQLLNPAIALDGDECISAMMVKHIMQGREFPLYFYRQSYGFTFIESMACLPISMVTGVSTFSMKFSMLLIWLVGVVFFYKALAAVNKGSSIVPFIIALLLATTPAWAVWSMKARGGYLTAFTLTSVVMYLLLDEQQRKKAFNYILAGLFTAIIYEAQPTWLVGLVPILCYCLWRRLNARSIVYFTTPMVILLAVLHVYKKNLYPAKPTIVKDIGAIVDNFSRIPEFLYYHLYGKYYMAILYPDNLFITVSAFAFIGIILLVSFAALYHLFFARTKDWLFIISTVAVWLIIFTTILAPHLEPRVLLPLTGAVLFSIQLGLNHLKSIKTVVISGWALICITITGTLTFWDFSSGKIKRTDILTIIDYLQKQEVQHVFVTYAVLDFQLIFYSDEKIMARTRWYPGRYPPYFTEVDNAFFSGKNVAVVGYPGEYDGMNLANVRTAPGYFIAVNPDKNEIKRVFYSP